MRRRKRDLRKTKINLTSAPRNKKASGGEGEARSGHGGK